MEKIEVLHICQHELGSFINETYSLQSLEGLEDVGRSQILFPDHGEHW